MKENLKKEKKKKILVISSIVAILIIAIGVTYAFYTYSNTGLESKLIAGEMYMKYAEGSALNISGAMPSATYPDSTTGNYFEFQITGKNTHETMDISYNLNLAYGDSQNSPKQRIRDQYLLFKLVEVNENVETTIVNDANYQTIPGATLTTLTVPHNTASVTTRTFRLYARISEKVGIGTNTTYTIADWNNLYASIKINAVGSLVSGSNNNNNNTPSLTGAEQLIANYEEDSDPSTNGGLIGINQNGELYDPNATGSSTTNNNAVTNNLVNKTSETKATRTDNTTTIREYRFSGNSGPSIEETTPEVPQESDSTMKNYIIFNGERWRIVGIFDSDDNLSNGCQNCRMKIVRNDPLSNLPSTYTNLDNKEFQLNSGENSSYPKPYSRVYWNYDSESNYNNNWTQAGLMYYLNEDNTGSYYHSIASNYKGFIDTTDYKLGSVSSIGVVSPQTLYTEERNTSSSNIHEGNSPTWSGKIGLLYPSDYAYSFPTGAWNSYGYADSWINGANTYGFRSEWFLSVSASHSYLVVGWNSGGLSSITASNGSALRPVLNLKSDTTIISGTGTYNNPYRIVAES